MKALADEPGLPQARFYLALAAEQDGKKAEAIRDYEALIADAPPDAHWVEAVKTRLASLKGEPPPRAARRTRSAAVPEAQKAMIEGMVSRLANRLASNGGSVDEWARLIRAYTVLHEADKAKAALADARKALAPDPNAVASLDALAHDLGLGERQLTRRSRRLALIAVALAVIGCAAGVALYALRDNIVFFYSPSEIAEKAVQPGARLRVGGLVKAGTLVKSAGPERRLCRDRRRA